MSGFGVNMDGYLHVLARILAARMDLSANAKGTSSCMPMTVGTAPNGWEKRRKGRRQEGAGGNTLVRAVGCGLHRHYGRLEVKQVDRARGGDVQGW